MEDLKMKKISFLFLLGILCLSPLIKAGNMPDYVVTGDDVTYFKKVRIGISSGLVGVNESLKVRYKADEVVAYCKDGHIYERMPVVVEGRLTDDNEFMELLAYRNGLKVYRHLVYTGGNKPCTDEYLVFNDGKYHVSFTEQNCKTLCKFFFKR